MLNYFSPLVTAALALQQQVEAFVDAGRQEERDPGAEDSWRWGGRDDGRRFGPAWLAVATFVHEVWLLLQHANILLNPLCQRLDRSYGVALVRFLYKRSVIFFFLCW